MRQPARPTAAANILALTMVTAASAEDGGADGAADGAIGATVANRTSIARMAATASSRVPLTPKNNLKPAAIPSAR